MAETFHLSTRRTPARFLTLFTAGFRFYFLAAGVFSVFAMLTWTLWLGLLAAGESVGTLPMRMAPQLWHAHEMVFGYTVAVMAGFFLTAVPSWTGTKEARTIFVTVSGAVWLLGRFAVWFSGLLDPILVAAVDLLFVPILATNILGRLARKSQARNAVFIVLLGGLFLANLLMHLDWIGWTEGTAQAGVRLGVFLSAAMIAIIGGRVVPAFTRNVLQREGYLGSMPRSHVWLERSGILLSLLAAVATLPFVPAPVTGVLCLGAGAVNLARLAGWKGWRILNSPILWVLHAAYLLLAAGYLLYGLSLTFNLVDETAALHLLAIGAVGGMTLAMMTRASLGHAGMPLKVSRLIVLAYAALIAAALTRVFGFLAYGYFEVMLLAGGLWVLAFGLFAGVYFPILSTPRAERQTGKGR
ncbi:NnrS family protein [Roseibium salinum]|uniref:NnrS family protein n=1 Tax=Roseibium salinum TaxID=1604349 RepID=A0ABT3R5W4_9HYPH|nr:NnrS family protein [Roseibium sp. DSM 29163]MCX2724674.1 NnrS family protein [Roseibium sp. DSM 29163]